MKHQNIVELIPKNSSDRLTSKTIEIWQAIYDYVRKNRFADVVDDDFVDSISREFNISKGTISRHLSRMAEQAILKPWVLVRKRGQVRMSMVFFFGNQPTRIVRYTLPGKKPPMQMLREHC